MSRVASNEFSSHLKEAFACADSSSRWHSLRSLCAGVDRTLDFLQTLQLDKAIQKAAETSMPDLPRSRLALLSSHTSDHLLPAIRVAALSRGIWIEIFKGDYGLYRQEILQPSPELVKFDPDYVLLSLSARDILSAVPVSADSNAVRDIVEKEVDQLRGLWDRIRGSLGASVIQQSYLDVTMPLFGNYDRRAPASPARVLYELNHRLLEAVREEEVLLLDIALASSREGTSHWFDLNRWLQGKLEISPAAANSYGDLVARIVGAERGLSRKCLVLDLDNTLWGGVIGDDGLDGIVLGEGSARGEAHLHLQRYAKQLKERGIILAICSKNEESVARGVFEQHPEMLLSLDDIAVFVANWNDKSSNLLAIAEHLNIGVDSLVFLDDNPAERARVRESLPAVAVPELTEDPAGYVDCLVREGYFEATSFTTDDTERANQYLANGRRAALQDGSQSLDEFLSGLSMTMTFGSVGPTELPRAVQLINKTNQFNTTGRRFQLEEVQAYIDDPARDALYFRLADRFGDNGLVSVLLSSICNNGCVLRIDSWVMSCRVFGRQFEREIMNALIETANARGVSEVRAQFVATERNGVIANLFEELGFRNSSATSAESPWCLTVAEFHPMSTHINREPMR
ncbi:MAG: HAD-IIIC family phosphatase [Pseudomonadales bacterium]